MDRASRDLAIQYAVTDALASSTTLREVARRAIAEICSALGWDVGALWLVDDAGAVVRCVASWRAAEASDAFVRDTETRLFPPGIGLPGRTWSRGEPQWVRDFANDPSFPRAGLAAKAGLHAAFAVPIRTGERISGVLEFFSSEIREPDAELLVMFAAVGRQMGQAVERLRSRDALRASEARLRGVVEAAADAVISMDEQGRVIEWNPRAEALFGWSRDEMIGRALTSTIIPERYRERHRAGLARFLRTGEGAYLNRRVEVAASRRDGSEMEIELAIVPVPTDDGHVFTAFARDIRQRRREDQRLRFLADIGEVLGASLDLETTLGRVAQIALGAIADYCVIHLADERGRLRRVAVVGRDPELDRRWAEARQPALLDAGEEHPAIAAFRDKRSILFDRVGDAERRRLATSEQHLAFLESIPLEQWLCVPLVAHGEAVGVVGLGTAVAERRWDEQDIALAEELARRAGLAVENARLYRQVRDAVRTRDEFLATVSHDLRNPLASVKGLAQLLRRRAERLATPETLALVDSLERIDQAATRMATLLDELIEVSGLRIGQSVELARAPVDLVTLARDVVRATPADGRRIEVEAPEPAVVAPVDAGRMQRVLANLVGNAVKFSPPAAAITVRIAREDGAVAIAIRDEGVGIPAADLPHIFERFRRGSNVAERIPGTGIGLTSAQQIVELHGGSIEVESVEGKGSTFTVRLPLDGGTLRRAP